MNEVDILSELKEVLSYDQKTGVFKWRKRITGQISAGSPAGYVDQSGYVVITYKKKRYKAHRLAWLFVNGRFPSKLIDHRNSIRRDNRYENLREADYFQNAQNSAVQKNSNSKIKGVCWAAHAKKWMAYVNSNGSRNHLGYFSNKDEAVAAVMAKREMLHREFHNHGSNTI